MFVLSRALQLWSSTSKCPCSSSLDEYEFCSGVGGIVLLLDCGGAFACEPSNLISFCVTVQECARFLEKEKDCGSTSARSEQQDKPLQTSVTHRRSWKQKHQSHQAQPQRTAIIQACNREIFVTNKTLLSVLFRLVFCSLSVVPHFCHSKSGLPILAKDRQSNTISPQIGASSPVQSKSAGED